MIMKMQLLMSPLSPVCLILTIIFRFDSFNKLNKTKQNKKERKKSQFKWKEKAEKKLYFSNCVYYEQRNFFFFFDDYLPNLYIFFAENFVVIKLKIIVFFLLFECVSVCALSIQLIIIIIITRLKGMKILKRKKIYQQFFNSVEIIHIFPIRNILIM